MFAADALVVVFLGLLGLMVVISGVFGLFVVARMVEPRGLKALLRKLAGKPIAS